PPGGAGARRHARLAWGARVMAACACAGLCSVTIASLAPSMGLCAANVPPCKAALSRPSARRMSWGVVMGTLLGADSGRVTQALGKSLDGIPAEKFTIRNSNAKCEIFRD